MLRNLISKFRVSISFICNNKLQLFFILVYLQPILRDVSGWGAIYSGHGGTRFFQVSPVFMQKGDGKLPPKMAKLQKQYQEDNGKPVFLKGGPIDNILYRLTLVLCVIGTIGDLYLWFGYILAT